MTPACRATDLELMHRLCAGEPPKSNTKVMGIFPHHHLPCATRNDFLANRGRQRRKPAHDLVLSLSFQKYIYPGHLKTRTKCCPEKSPSPSKWFTNRSTPTRVHFSLNIPHSGHRLRRGVIKQRYHVLLAVAASRDDQSVECMLDLTRLMDLE